MPKAATTKKPNTSEDLDAFLLGGAKPAAKAKKDGPPVITGYGALADKVNNKRKAVSDAEAEFRLAEDELLNVVRPRYEAGASGKGDFAQTYNIPGMETTGVQITWKDSYKALPIERKGQLIETLGQEAFDKNYTVDRTLTVKKATDVEIQLLREKLGDEVFMQIFGIEIKINAKPDMDRRYHTLAEDARPEQHKPSTKLIK